MTIVIGILLIVGFVLIATEKLTNVNKSAVAIFIGTLAWILYIMNGAEYVLSQHPAEYAAFLDGITSTSATVKQFIAQNIFLKYVGKASEIVLFLLATMTIVEILQNNGCFDFITQLMRTHSSKRLLWIVSVVTFIISANLENLTTTVMMLTMLHGIVRTRRQRMLYGCAVVISANCGGALTVIGDPTGLVLWNSGAVTATDFSMSLALPCLMAWMLPVWWIGRMLPDRADTEWITLPYRGDDTRLNVWQRFIMLIVGIGGLWFIPTFHNITKLSPFLGALCVLSVLWIVNEVVNRKLLQSEDMAQRRIPRVLQYGVIQMILFVMGIILVMGVVRETGIMATMSEVMDNHIQNVWITGLVAGAISSVLDNFATAMTMISMRDNVLFGLHSAADISYFSQYMQSGIYWKVVAYASAVGGNVLCTSSMSGLALMKMERMRFGWFFRNVGWKALVGAAAGFAFMFLAFWLSA